MKLWLGVLVSAIAIFVLVQWRTPVPAPRPLPTTLTVSSSNARGATLTMVIHRRDTIEQVLQDLEEFRASVPTLPCQANAGDYLAVFSDPSGVETSVTVEKGGCQQVSVAAAGRSTRTGRDDQLLREFDDLFPPSWQTGI